MNVEEIKQNIKKCFKEVFPEIKEDNFDFNKKQEDFENWDSFSHMELVSKIEENYNINLETEEVIELDSPQKFVDIVNEKTKN